MEAFDFIGWDTLAKTLDTDLGFNEVLNRGKYYLEHYHNLARNLRRFFSDFDTFESQHTHTVNNKTEA